MRVLLSRSAASLNRLHPPTPLSSRSTQALEQLHRPIPRHACMHAARTLEREPTAASKCWCLACTREPRQRDERCKPREQSEMGLQTARMGVPVRAKRGTCSPSCICQSGSSICMVCSTLRSWKQRSHWCLVLSPASWMCSMDRCLWSDGKRRRNSSEDQGPSHETGESQQDPLFGWNEGVRRS